MRLLELVLQGVAGRTDLLRLPMGPGVNLLAPRGEGLPLGRVLGWLLHDAGPEALQALRVPGLEVARGAVTLQGRGGEVVRLVRELDGAVQVSSWDGGSRTFTPLGQAPDAIQALLHERGLIPDAGVLQDLLCIGVEWPAEEAGGPRVPSFVAERARRQAAARDPDGRKSIHGEGLWAAEGRGPGAPARSLPRAVAPALDAPWGALEAAPDVAPVDRTALGRRLAELEALRVARRTFDEMQFRLDALHQEAAALEERLRRVRACEAEATRLQAALEAEAELDHVPEDFPAVAQAWQGRQERFTRSMERLQAGRDELESRLAHAPAPPWRAPLFVGGLAATVVITAVALFAPGLRWLALADPLGLGAAALAIWRWIDDQERRERDVGRTQGFEERRRALEAQFETETAEIRTLLARLGAATPAEVIERLSRREALKAELAAADAKRREAGEGVSLETLAAERTRLDGEIQLLEGQLTDTDGRQAGPGDLEGEIAALQAALATGTASVAAAATRVEGVTALDPADPVARLLDRLAGLLGLAPAEAGERVGWRLQAYVTALTHRAWSGADFDEAGRLVLAAGGGRRTRLEELGERDLFLVRLALRLALAEVALEHHPQPLLLEAPFDALDLPRKALVASVLRNLAEIGQVVHQSTDAFWEQTADAVHRID